MTTSTFILPVPVDEFEITDGPGLKRLSQAEGAYEPSMGITVTLTLRTLASKRTSVRRVTAYYFAELGSEECEFLVILSHSVYRCRYHYATRTGTCVAYSTDDLVRYFQQEAATMGA